MSSHTNDISRRTVLKLGATAGASALVAPIPLPFPRSGRLFGSTTANDTIQLGAIGTGRMGRGDIKMMLMQGLKAEVNARFVAVCDVDANRAADAKKLIDELYAAHLEQDSRPEIEIYRDFRELLERKDIDGVTISTPDFWHANNAIAAANAGKDIYVQKPMTFTVNEGKQLVRAVRNNEIVLQVGSQQRSDGRFRQACTLVRNGRVGKLQRIIVYLPEDHGSGDPMPSAVPETFDYDRWIGPTEPTPYAEGGVHPKQGYGRPGWLQIQRYTCGMITGWGAHMNDIAQWGHGGDRDSGIVAVEAKAEFPQRGLFDVHTVFESEAEYADGVKLVQKTGKPAGVRFEGSDGWIFVQRGGIKSGPVTILEEEIEDGELQLYFSANHYRNFLECMRSRQDPACPVEIGHRSNSVCVVTHIAMKLGRKLRWDPVEECFSDDAEANAMLDYPHRQPWEL